MTALDLAERIATCLDEDGIDYAIGGALALTALAIPRDTKDVDISVFAPTERVFDALERAGVMLDRTDALSAITRIGMFTGRAGRTLVDVFVGEHPHFQSMHERRRQYPFPSGRPGWFLSAEDLCVLKLLYGRPKDVGDLERMFAAVSDIDLEYVRRWVAQLPGSEARIALLDDLARRFRG